MQKLFYVCLMLMVVSLSNSLTAQDFPIIRLVLVQGDEVPGVGTIESIGDVAINDLGETLIVANTDNPSASIDEVLLRNGEVLLQEGITGQLNSPPDAFIAGAEPLAGLFTSLNISNSGETSYFLSIEDFPGSEDFGIFTGADIVIQQGGLASNPQFSPGTTYDFLSSLKQNNNGALLFAGLADDPMLGGASLDEFIAISDAVTEEVVVADGDFLPGSNLPVMRVARLDNLSSINDNNDVMFGVEFGVDDDEDSAIYLNDTLLAHEGQPSPVSGRNWGPLQVSGVDLNNSGDYVFKGVLDGAGLSGDQLIIKNGDVIMQEGATAPDGNPIQNFGMLAGPIEIGNNGSAIYQARSTAGVTFLFLDDQLIVHEGVTTTEDGTIIADITSLGDVADSSEVMDLSSDGNWAIFEGTVISPSGASLQAAFTIQFEDQTGGGPVEVPASSFIISRGVLVAGGQPEITMSDDARLLMNPGFTLNNMEAPVWLIFDANLATDSPASLDASYEASAGTPGLTATLEAWNWTTSAFDVIDDSAPGFNNDTIVTASILPSLYVEPATAAVQTRIGWRQTGFVINFPWEVRIDQVLWIQQ